jgi:hypothetical protein
VEDGTRHLEVCRLPAALINPLSDYRVSLCSRVSAHEGQGISYVMHEQPASHATVLRKRPWSTAHFGREIDERPMSVATADRRPADWWTLDYVVVMSPCVDLKSWQDEG